MFPIIILLLLLLLYVLNRCLCFMFLMFPCFYYLKIFLSRPAYVSPLWGTGTCRAEAERRGRGEEQEPLGRKSASSLGRIFCRFFGKMWLVFEPKRMSNPSEIIWVVQLHISSTISPGVVWIRLWHRHISDELIRAVSFYLSVTIFFLWHRNFLVLAKKKWILVVP